MRGEGGHCGAKMARALAAGVVVAVSLAAAVAMAAVAAVAPAAMAVALAAMALHSAHTNQCLIYGMGEQCNTL